MSAATEFFKVNAGETRVLQFTGDMEAVQRTFKRKNKDGSEVEQTKQMYAYKVLDMDNQDKGIQTWEISRQWSDNIDHLLKKGFITLEVIRTGDGMTTDYKFSPVIQTSPSTTS